MLPGQKTKGAHADARGRSMMRRRRVACEPRSKISCSHQRTRSLLSRALGKPLTHRPLHPLRVLHSDFTWLGIWRESTHKDGSRTSEYRCW